MQTGRIEVRTDVRSSVYFAGESAIKNQVKFLAWVVLQVDRAVQLLREISYMFL